MRILTLLLLGGLTAQVYGDAGTSAASFLKLGAGPRAIAMGDAQVAVADDAYATYWNPAGLAQLQIQEAAFTHTQYVESINHQYAAYVYPHPRWGSFGASVSYLSYGSFPGYDAVGQTMPDVSANDMSLGFSYAHNILFDDRYGMQLAAGGTVKWIRERLDTVSASAMAADGGVLFAPGIRWGEWLSGVKAGLTLRNLGTPLEYDHDSFALPRTLAAGLAYTGHWREESFTLACDLRHTNEGLTSFGTGVEIWTLQSFVMRAGYTNEGDLSNGLRIGAGVKFKTLQVDYAFASQGDFGATHRFGLTLRFAPPKENPLFQAQRAFQRGMNSYEKQRYTEALVDFNKALELDPSHPDALEMMKKTYENLKQDGTILAPR
jgi:tetratricopeptide (TPR) repeat protein